jgi:hypothetical protein
MQPISLRKTLLIAGAIGILIIVMVISALNKAAGQDQENDSVEGQENTQPAPAASPEPHQVQGLPEGDRDQIPQIIQQFVTAYASHSWLDSGAGDWLEKTKPFTTTAYQKALEAELAGNEDSPSWAAFKRAQTKTAPEDITTVIVTADAGKASVIIDYQVLTTTGGSPAGQPEPFHRMATLKKSGTTWLVDSFTEAVGVPVPPSNPPLAPPTEGTSVGD